MQFEFRRARKIQEANDERVQSVYFGRNIAGQFRNEWLGSCNFAIEHFRGALDHTQGIADFMREPCRELTQRRQTLGAAGIGLGAAQLPVSLFKFFRKNLQSRNLAAILHHKLIHQNGRNIKERNPDREDGGSRRSELIFLKRRNQQRGISEGCDSCPCERGDSPQNKLLR